MKILLLAVAAAMAVVVLMRGLASTRSIDVKHNSGQIIGGDVHGDVIQHQKAAQEQTPAEKSRWLNTTNIVIALLSLAAGVAALFVN